MQIKGGKMMVIWPFVFFVCIFKKKKKICFSTITMPDQIGLPKKVTLDLNEGARISQQNAEYNIESRF